MKQFIILTLAALALTACAPRNPGAELGPDGQPIPVAYTINAAEAAAIPDRVLGQINTLRAGSGAVPLRLDPGLAAAAAAHSRDMAAQNRAWHFGSDGSSPLDRARRAGYAGQLVGENISESYENDVATLQAWMQARDTRDVIMDPSATALGVAWYQEPSRKIWWTLVTGK
ncbi:divisome-associated lipoprotein DalA [Paracoccus xiamenensis]|uniref:CAP domain-containing protein n=1 Tax=Paracoccus xiamenensis TaxID=2714901 RepID=UPI00140E1CD7|nr:CAP domain-containing protein [Paracoccus xiamenensis]NHF73687.1 CAP domain-containing protein [Paracoccus xiamenensis]